MMKIDPRVPSRFTFKQFSLIVWQMSQDTNLHYIDFCTLYDAELKLLYRKTNPNLLKKQEECDCDYCTEEWKKIAWAKLQAKKQEEVHT